MTMKLSVYDYIDAAFFIKDLWEEKRKINPAFSLRAWSKQMGFKTHTPLHYMIHGERNIPKKYIPFFIKSLNLNAKQGLYFETLVDLQRAKTIEEKDIYLERLRELSPKPLRDTLEVEMYKYLKDPIHILICEMTELRGFKNDPAWIKRKFAFNISMLKIQDAIDRMISLGLIKDEGGYLIKQYKHISNKLDIADKGVQDYHKNISKLAADLIETQDVKDREYNSFSMNIKKEDMNKIKESFRTFTNEFIQAYESKPGEGEATYQFNLQFFGLTN